MSGWWIVDMRARSQTSKLHLSALHDARSECETFG